MTSKIKGTTTCKHINLGLLLGNKCAWQESEEK
jgi:hypothetical protein